MEYGLEPLSPELIHSRITQLRNQNTYSKAFLDTVERHNNAGDSNRAGMVWFFHCQQQLRKPSLVFRLLSTWGGEALYWGHEDSKELLRELRSIGEPCIIVALLKPEDIFPSPRIENRMLQIWHKRDDEVDGFDTDTDVTRSILVEGIITFSNPFFEDLTGSSEWRVSLA